MPVFTRQSTSRSAQIGEPTGASVGELFAGRKLRREVAKPTKEAGVLRWEREAGVELMPAIETRSGSGGRPKPPQRSPGGGRETGTAEPGKTVRSDSRPACFCSTMFRK